MARRTMASPGSLIVGMPASETTSTVSPFATWSSSASALPRSLWSWLATTRPPTCTLSRLASAYNLRVSSAATMSARSSSATSRAEASAVLPIGVAASTTVPRGTSTWRVRVSSAGSSAMPVCSDCSFIRSVCRAGRSAGGETRCDGGDAGAYVGANPRGRVPWNRVCARGRRACEM